MVRWAPPDARTPWPRSGVSGAAAGRAGHAPSFRGSGRVYAAIRPAWPGTIYEPEGQRVLTPVSRIWNVDWGGFVLFEWDNYFAAYLAGVEQRDLAYANAIEMTRAITESGFIPNFATVQGVLSRDRSEQPVGALVVRELYRKYGDRWFLEEVYPNLLRWNSLVASPAGLRRAAVLGLGPLRAGAGLTF